MKKYSPTSYHDLTPDQELTYMLWLEYLEESISNAFLQMSRWKRDHRGWDLHMFFVSMVGIYDSAMFLKRFVGADAEFKEALDIFIKGFEANDIKHWRDNILHRKNIYENRDRDNKPLPKDPVWVLGGYNYSTDKYEFKPYSIRVSDAFLVVRNLRRRIRASIKKRLIKAYMDKSNGPIQGMIPYTKLHTLFAEKGKKQTIPKH